MKKFLLQGPYIYEIRHRRENPYPDKEKWFHDYFDARRFLRGLWLDRSNMTTMRLVLAGDFTGRSPAGLTDDEVVEQLARRFASGQLCVTARHDRFPPGAQGGEPGEGTARQYPTAPSPSPPATVSGTPPGPEPSLAAAAAQARALKQAAKSGSHFCEA